MFHRPHKAAPRSAALRSSEPLWRAIAVFRFASLGYAALLIAVIDRDAYLRPGWAWAVFAAMTAWTAVTTVAYAQPRLGGTVTFDKIDISLPTTTVS